MSSALAVAACKDGQEVCAKKRKKFDHAPRPKREQQLLKDKELYIVQVRVGWGKKESELRRCVRCVKGHGVSKTERA